MKNCFHISLVLAAVVSICDVSLSDEQPGNQTTAQLDTQVKVEMGYLLYLPKDYDKQDSWPLVLFLHGAGERGDDLELVNKHGPPKLIAAGKEFPFVVVSPQCPRNRWWEPFELIALLDEISGKYKVDADRIYLTGLSMGGFGTWRLAFYAPGKFAAIAPICGGGEKYWAKQFSHLPVWAFHGGRSQVMVDALKKSGGNPKLTIYPGAGHDSWTETYDNPKFYEWLLEQKRTTRERTSLKGWELYIWIEDGKTHFSLVIGTNRLKSDDEIAKSAVKGFEAIKPMLDQLKRGEFVFVHGRRLRAEAPDELAKLVTEHCKNLGLKAR